MRIKLYEKNHNITRINLNHCACLTGAVTNGHRFALSSISIKSRERDLVFFIVLHSLQDRSFALTAHLQLKHSLFESIFFFTHFVQIYSKSEPPDLSQLSSTQGDPFNQVGDDIISCSLPVDGDLTA